MNWCDHTINWRWGLRATKSLTEISKCDSIVKTETFNDNIKIDPDEIESKTKTVVTLKPDLRSLKNSLLDFNDIEAEKGNIKFTTQTKKSTFI